MRFRPRRGEVGVSLGLVALAALSIWQTTVIPVSPIYARVGPTLFPWIASIGLLVLSLLLLAEALRSGFADVEPQLSMDWHSLAWVVAGLVANLALIGTLGFVVAAVATFVCVARGFGSTALLRDALIGATVSFAAYIGFDRLLGVNIGSGIMERLL